MKNLIMKPRRCFLCAACALAVVLVPHQASSFDLASTVIAGGGGSSTGGNFTVEATIGQPTAGTLSSSNGVQSMQVGFWFTLVPSLKIISITRLANGHILLWCMGVPNNVNHLQTSSDLSPGSFVTISPAPPAADASGAFQYDDAAAAGLTKRFYRLAFP
jgi:hypothetical protein